MATFKVGDRVKRVKSGMTEDGPLFPIPLGTTGTVTGGEVFMGCDWTLVAWDVELPKIYHDVLSHTLAPLDDPAADAFLERIRKLKPYDEPKVVTTEHGTALFPK